MSFKKITSFKKACKELKRPTDLPVYPEWMSEEEKEKLIAEYELGVIRDAIVGKTLDYSDGTYKYFPVIWFVPGSGWRVNRSRYSYCAGSLAGSRLDFETIEQSDFFGKTFIDKLSVLKK